MKVIGLTGGIGSGKTTVAREFQKLNVPVYIADDRSKFLLSNNSEIIELVKSLLGNEAYEFINGVEKANRAFIASKVFTDKKMLEKLNAILHPAVHKDFEKFSLEYKGLPYLIYEAAILFETGGESRCDKTILVTASKEERLNRVMKRDGVTQTAVENRMQHQWSQERKLGLADYIVINDNVSLLSKKINLLHLFMINN